MKWCCRKNNPPRLFVEVRNFRFGVGENVESDVSSLVNPFHPVFDDCLIFVPLKCLPVVQMMHKLTAILLSGFLALEVIGM